MLTPASFPPEYPEYDGTSTVMRMTRTPSLLLVAILISVLGAACGDGSTPDELAGNSVTTPTAAVQTDTSTPSVSSGTGGGDSSRTATATATTPAGQAAQTPEPAS